MSTLKSDHRSLKFSSDPEQFEVYCRRMLEVMDKLGESVDSGLWNYYMENLNLFDDLPGFKDKNDYTDSPKLTLQADYRSVFDYCAYHSQRFLDKKHKYNEVGKRDLLSGILHVQEFLRVRMKEEDAGDLNQDYFKSMKKSHEKQMQSWFSRLKWGVVIYVLIFLFLWLCGLLQKQLILLLPLLVSIFWFFLTQYIYHRNQFDAFAYRESSVNTMKALFKGKNTELVNVILQKGLSVIFSNSINSKKNSDFEKNLIIELVSLLKSK